MKIVCDSCGAKYSIADEKVQGKVFKIRCKKCSHVIVVKGQGDEAGAGGDGLGGDAGAAEWYVVIDGDQVGPVTSTEIDSYFMSGQINAETYAWKDGMGDWMHIVTIPEFRHLAQDVAGPNEATQIADSGHRYDQGETDATNVVQSPLAMSGGEASDPTMGDSPSALGYGSDPYPADPGYGEDDYGYGDSGGGYGGYGGYDGGGMGGALAAAGGDDDGGGMFAAFDSGGGDSDFMAFGGASSSSPKSNGSNGAGAGGVGEGLVGQRNENSVLFSLSSLDSVSAVGGGGGGGSSEKDVPITEGSGLIDIQALATAHKSLSSGNDSDMGGIDPFAQGAMAMPALMPMGSHRNNNPLYIGLAAGGVALLALVGVVIYVVASKDDQPQQPQVIVKEVIKEKIIENPIDQAKAAQEASEAEKAALAAAAAEPKKVEEEEPESKDAAKKSTKSSGSKAVASKKSDEPKDEPAPEPKKKKDGIDAILDNIDKKAEKQEASEDSSSSAKKALSRNDVSNTIKRYNSRISTCAKSQNSSGKSGTVKVKFYIQPNGRVRGSQIVDSGFKGTDVGGCVEKVVDSMTFPKTSASKDLPVTYPFILK